MPMKNAFHKLRLAAGYKLRQLASILHVDRNTLARWDRGEWRPRWNHMPGLAQLFGLDTAKAIKLFWKESVGDPCECGCGGEKVLPTKHGAKHLYIECPCKECGTARTFGVAQGHVDLCRRCSYASRKVERIELTCVGYRPYSAVVPLFAKRCLGAKEFLPRTIRLAQRKSDEGEEYPFIDAEHRKYRCKFCAGAFRLLQASEDQTKQRWKKIHPRRPVPRIRNLEELRRLQREVTDQAVFSSETPKPKRGKDIGHRKWRREKSPAPVRGLCGICGNLLFSYKKSREIRFHQDCLWKYQREHAAEAGPRNADGTFTATSSKPIEEQRRRGAPVQLESLQKHFAWAIRNKLLNDSLGDIAESDGIKSRSTVKEGVEFIMQHLPPPEYVPPQIRGRISALRSST